MNSSNRGFHVVPVDWATKTILGYDLNLSDWNHSLCLSAQPLSSPCEGESGIIAERDALLAQFAVLGKCLMDEHVHPFCMTAVSWDNSRSVSGRSAWVLRDIQHSLSLWAKECVCAGTFLLLWGVAVCRICRAYALRSVMQRVASHLRHTKTYRQLLADDMIARRG